MKRNRVFACACLCMVVLCASSTTLFVGRLRILPEWSYSKTVGASTATQRIGALLDWSHTTGTNTQEMTTLISGEYALTNSASVTVDLTSAVNGFGDSVSFSTVKFIAVSAGVSNLNSIAIGGAASGALANWTGTTNDTVIIQPGGAFCVVAPGMLGYAVGSSGNLKITNTGTNAVSCYLYVAGF